MIAVLLFAMPEKTFAAAEVATPTFSLAPGTYTTEQTVRIADSAVDAVIHYTTNGVAPTVSSPIYLGPVTLVETTTLRAIAALPDGSVSSILTVVYTIVPAAIPTFDRPAGIYTTNQTVTIRDATTDAVIYYTTDGVAPTTDSAVYTGPISIDHTTTLRAIAVRPNGPASGNFTAVFTIEPAATPTFSEPAGTYETAQTVAIRDATPGAVIYYTTNGVAPTTAAAVYAGPVALDRTTTLRAVAARPNGPASPNFTAVFTIIPAAAPTFSPPAGEYTGYRTVTIQDSTPGAAIYYTINGAAPTTASTRYTGPLSIGGNLKLRAIAALPGGPPSLPTTGVYTIIQSFAPIKTPNSSPNFFGMDINHLLDGTPWPDISIGTIRLWNTVTFWGILNPAPNTYAWGNLDEQIALAKSHRAEVVYTFGGVPPWALPTNVAIRSIARSGGTVTVTTAAPHGMYYDPQQPAEYEVAFTVAGVSDASLNGTFAVTGTPDAHTFTYAQAGADSSAASGEVSVLCGGSFAPAACSAAPARLADWDAYVTQMIDHIGPGAIKYWELWNEPNIPIFWQGDPALLVAMAADARRIIKSVDPEAIILSPGVTGNYETNIECNGDPSYCGSAWLSNWFALGGASTIDAVAYHGYPAIGPEPEQIQGSVDLLHQTMAEAGIGSLALLDTEASWGANRNLPEPADERAWLARHFLLEQSMGVERSFWYAYDSSTWGTMWTPVDGQNATGGAYAEIENWLTGATLTRPCYRLPSDATTFDCGYSRANGYVAEAIWNTVGSKQVAVPEGFVQYRDLAGGVTAVSEGMVEISTTPILLENRSAF